MNNHLYFVDFDNPKQFQGVGKYVATSKARYDVTNIIESNFKTKRIVVERSIENKLFGPIEVICKLFFVLKKIPKGETVFVQYPFINLKAFKYVSSQFKRYHSIALIHDLQSYRYPKKNKVEDEIRILNCFSVVIAHTSAMKETLIKAGVKNEIRVLKVFDYLLDDNQTITKEPNTVVFAGDLSKSIYLTHLKDIPISHISFNLYGKGIRNEVETEKIKYKGLFSPDEISPITGEWGLLWEGNSIETCSGDLGNYLSIIASHKFSLYLACGLKLIVWDKGAMAPFVKENGIGITISSLRDIDSKIASLSDEEKNQMEDNVKTISAKIRKGDYLSSVMRQSNF